MLNDKRYQIPKNTAPIQQPALTKLDQAFQRCQERLNQDSRVSLLPEEIVVLTENEYECFAFAELFEMNQVDKKDFYNMYINAVCQTSEDFWKIVPILWPNPTQDEVNELLGEYPQHQAFLLTKFNLPSAAEKLDNSAANAGKRKSKENTLLTLAKNKQTDPEIILEHVKLLRYLTLSQIATVLQQKLNSFEGTWYQTFVSHCHPETVVKALMNEENAKRCGLNTFMLIIGYFSNAIEPMLNIMMGIAKNTRGKIMKQADFEGWNASMLVARNHPGMIVPMLRLMVSLDSNDKLSIFLKTDYWGWSFFTLAAAFQAVDFVKPILPEICILPGGSLANIFSQVVIMDYQGLSGGMDGLVKDAQLDQAGPNGLVVVILHCPDLVNVMLEKVISIISVNNQITLFEQTWQGCNPLMWSIRKKSRAFPLMLKHVNDKLPPKNLIVVQQQVDEDGQNALMLMARYYPEYFESLLKNIADKLPPEEQIKIFLQEDAQGKNLFEILAEEHPELVPFIVSHAFTLDPMYRKEISKKSLACPRDSKADFQLQLLTLVAKLDVKIIDFDKSIISSEIVGNKSEQGKKLRENLVRNFCNYLKNPQDKFFLGRWIEDYYQLLEQAYVILNVHRNELLDNLIDKLPLTSSEEPKTLKLAKKAYALLQNFGWAIGEGGQSDVYKDLIDNASTSSEDFWRAVLILHLKPKDKSVDGFESKCQQHMDFLNKKYGFEKGTENLALKHLSKPKNKKFEFMQLLYELRYVSTLVSENILRGTVSISITDLLPFGKSTEGYNPLMLAIEANYSLEAIRLILALIIELSPEVQVEIFTQVSLGGSHNPLTLAARFNPEAVEPLLKAIEKHEEDKQVLMFRPEKAAMLISNLVYGSNLDPIQLAAIHNPDQVRLLVKHILKLKPENRILAYKPTTSEDPAANFQLRILKLITKMDQRIIQFADISNPTIEQNNRIQALKQVRDKLCLKFSAYLENPDTIKLGELKDKYSSVLQDNNVNLAFQKNSSIFSFFSGDSEKPLKLAEKVKTTIEGYSEKFVVLSK